MCDVETPGEQTHERVALRRRRSRGFEVPDQRNANGADVEALSVRAHHVLVDPPAAPFIDGAEPVDEKVVADVVPAVPDHVVELDAANDRRRLRAGVIVGAGGVMHDREPEVRCDHRTSADDLLIGVPGTPRHEHRRPCRLGRAHRSGENA